MLKEDQLVITNENGEEAVCDILFTHEHKGKNYVVFEFVETGEVSAAVYVPGETEEEGTFLDIETDQEWDMLDKALQDFYDQLEAEEETDEEEEA